MLTTRTTKAEIKEFLINGANETKDKVWNNISLIDAYKQLAKRA